MATRIDFERSDCGLMAPCYRYIRQADQLPTLEELHTEEPLSVVARVRIFAPEGSMAWYIAAYDGVHHLAWGAVATQLGFETGAIAMLELVALRTPRLHLPVERDLYYQPASLAQLAATWLRRSTTV
jgi:hypothetical protein